MPNQVMLNDFMKYPVDWETSLLGEVVDINPETIGTGTPGTFHFKYIDISSVNLGNISWDTVTNQVLSSAPSRARRVARSEDVLFSTVRPGLQSHAYAEWPMQNYYICSTGFAILRAKRMHPRFLYHLIFSDEVSSQVRKLELGSNYPAINESDVSTLCIPIPPGAEQRRIAEILDTIDEAIQKTEALISKLKAMKQGLLHDLLTRGLDKNGKLRDPKAHPEQFKDSSLGRIPREWDVISLGDSFEELYRYPTYYGITYVDYGVPEVRGELIKEDGTMEENAADYRYINRETADRFPRVHLEPGDFVMSVRGTMGKIAIVPKRLCGAVITANLIRMKFVKSVVVSEWARHFLCSAFFQAALDLATSATTIKTIQVPQLCSIPFRRPLVDEQIQIADILAAHDARISTEEQYRDKLKLQKKGLMHDLLTGKVRVQI